MSDERNVAVAFVHGTGSKSPDYAEDTIEALRDRVAERMPEDASEESIVYKGVYWADIPHEKEEEVWQRIVDEDALDQLELRRFIFNLLGDTLAYQPSEGRRELYLEVHRRMQTSFAELADEVGPDAPLCIVAHSLGTVVAHNYLYDMQNEPERADELERPDAALARGDTLALLCTYGSPIAIWRLRFGDDYKAIEFPGVGLAEHYPDLEARWFNVFDTDDILAYPIANLTERYRELAEAGELVDVPREVGGLFTSWNPLSHTDYFDDGDTLDQLAGWIVEVWRGAYGEGSGTESEPEDEPA